MFTMTRGIALGVAATALLTGCQPEFVIHRERQPIIGGTLVTDVGPQGQFPTVVAVFNGGLCTGTLVAPDVVLTAAHCVDPTLLGFANQQQVTNNTIVIFDSNNLFDPNQGFAVAARDTIPNPGYDVFVQGNQIIPEFGDDDIAVVLLAIPITDRAPSPIDLDPTRNLIGTPVTLVGYGQTVGGGNGGNTSGRLFSLQKNVTDCAFFGLSNNLLVCFDQTNGNGSCNGDSGGPAFANINGVPTVVGVTSFGDENCAIFGVYTRTAGERDFIENFALGGCDATPDNVCTLGCNEIDPDCVEPVSIDDVAGGCAVSAEASPKGTLATLLLFALAFFISRRHRFKILNRVR